MKNNQLLDEIREANMTYLILAQRMIRDDRDEALYRLGVSAEVAEIQNGGHAGHDSLLLRRVSVPGKASARTAASGPIAFCRSCIGRFEMDGADSRIRTAFNLITREGITINV